MQSALPFPVSPVAQTRVLVLAVTFLAGSLWWSEKWLKAPAGWSGKQIRVDPWGQALSLKASAPRTDVDWEEWKDCSGDARQPCPQPL